MSFERRNVIAEPRRALALAHGRLLAQFASINRLPSVERGAFLRDIHAELDNCIHLIDCIRQVVDIHSFGEFDLFLASNLRTDHDGVPTVFNNHYVNDDYFASDMVEPYAARLETHPFAWYGVGANVAGYERREIPNAWGSPFPSDHANDQASLSTRSRIAEWQAGIDYSSSTEGKEDASETSSIPDLTPFADLTEAQIVHNWVYNTGVHNARTASGDTFDDRTPRSSHDDEVESTVRPNTPCTTASDEVPNVSDPSASVDPVVDHRFIRFGAESAERSTLSLVGFHVTPPNDTSGGMSTFTPCFDHACTRVHLPLA